jgi:hypothetical protein
MRKKALSIVGLPSDPTTLLLHILRAAIRRKAFAEALRATGNTTLVFADPEDTVLGIGLSMDNANAEDPSKWKGQNLYGQTLMAVRKEIPEGDLVDVVLEGGSFEEKIDLEGMITEQAKERKAYFIGLQQRKARFA